jgi:hypothetical protein
MISPSDDVVTGAFPLQSSEKRFTDTKAVRICDIVRSVCGKETMQLTTLATGDKIESVKSEKIVKNTTSQMSIEDLRIVVMMPPA